MKSLLKTLLPVCVFITLTAARCNKELPPETQEGKGTFGCLVNGQVFLPKGSVFGGSILTCYYQHIYPSANGYVFQVSAKDTRVSDDLKMVVVNIDSMKVYTGLVIDLASGKRGVSAQGQHSSGNSFLPYRFYTTDIYSGILSITKFDEVNQVVSGTFWFNAINSFGDTVKITDGRFDMKYTR